VIDLPDGATVEDLLARARERGIATEQANEVLLDGHSVDRSTPLKDGSAVTLIGQVHGI
jgi:molybdopterin converting factor small subunit